MNKFFRFCTSIFVTIIIFVASINFSSAAENLHTGTGVYKFADSSGVNDDPINVYYYRPKNWKKGDKIFTYFHGSGRHSQGFIRGMKALADKKNFLIVGPEFTQAKFPGDRSYNYGRVRIKNKITPKTEWTYNTVNRIIDDVKSRTDSPNSNVVFFGHSAGSQFIHRYLFFADKIKADKIIAANAGTYLMPDENIRFPFGLKNVPTAKKNLKRAYSSDVIILLGENDVKNTARGFPKSKIIDGQGLNRLERGKNFFAKSKAKAEEMGVEFNWRLITVPKVGHSSVRMAKNVLKYIY
ncbi:MAG: alpha/beta hydrolase [Selenomonadaceae bacterium]|nr:alpha/beta hydrolase [Selenomonadaceae bacterium]